MQYEPKSVVPEQAYDHLEIMPEPNPAKAGSTVTLGDLHGNTMKLIWFLIREGAISMSLDDYNSLSDIYYYSENLSEDNAQSFIEILNNITIENPNFCARFIGDMFADRGNNDYLTLKVLEKINLAGIKTEIIYSNHDAILLANYKKDLEKWGLPMGEKWNQSMNNLNYYIMKKPENLHKEVADLIDQYVLPNLKLISYSLSSNGKKIDIFIHAPNNYSDIIKTANIYDTDLIGKLCKEGHLPMATELAELFDKINTEFLNKKIELKEEPTVVFDFIWNRLSTNKGNIDINSYPKCVDHIIHGHTESENPAPQQINLDTYFGKILGPWKDTNRVYLPIYKTFVDEGLSLKDLKKLEEEEKKAASPPTVDMLTLTASNSPPTEKSTPDSMKPPTPAPEFDNKLTTEQERPKTAYQPYDQKKGFSLFKTISPLKLDSTQKQEQDQPSELTKK